MTKINKIGYETTWYNLKSPIELTFEPWEYGVFAINKELGVHAIGYTEEEALKTAQEQLALNYEDSHHITDDKYTQFGLNAKYKLLEHVDFKGECPDRGFNDVLNCLNDVANHD